MIENGENKEQEKITEEQPKPEKHYILKIKEYIDLRYEFRRNKLTLEIEYRPLTEKNFSVLDEPTLNTIWIDMQLDGYKESV